MATPNWHWTKHPLKEKIQEKIKRNLKGRKVWNSGVKGAQINPLKGKQMPLEWALKAADGRKGKCGGWNKGLTVKDNPNFNHGKKHHFWKGDKVGIKALHQWVKRYLGRPKVCEFCKKHVDDPYAIHWANKSGEYKRDLNDWIRLCRDCHINYDKRQRKNML